MSLRTQYAVAALVGITAAAAFAPPLQAQAASQQKLPKNWTYEVDSHGNRLLKTNRVTQPDGSWREEIRQGNCLTIRERAATGEYKESQRCTPPKSS